MPHRDASIDLDYPFAGRWLTQNSPANRVPATARPCSGSGVERFVPLLLRGPQLPAEPDGRAADVT
jgi:hypothetical protein